MARAIDGLGVDDSSELGRNLFGIKRVVIPIAKMNTLECQRLSKRLRSELDAVRHLLSKAELHSCVSSAPGKEDEEQASVEDDDGCRAAKSRKVSPFAERARERLAGRLASLAAALPDHVVAFLQNQRAGDAGHRGDDGEIEMDGVQSIKEGALSQLKMLLDKFVPAQSTPKLLVTPEVSMPKSCGGRAPLAASTISCLSQAQHQEAGDRMPPVQEEECGGVSLNAIRDIVEDFGELVDDIGVQLLSPLHPKYVDLTEQDRYVDICGDASPVVFPAKTCNSPSSDSDATSTDSDSSSSSPESGEPVPDPIPIQGKQNAQPPEPALEAIQIAEPKNQCATTVFAVTKSPPTPTPTVVPKECGPLPLEQAPREAVQIAEPDEEPLPTPTPAVLPNESATSSQPAPQDEDDQRSRTETGDLIAMARQEGKRRAKAKARQKLLEMEKAALPDGRILPQDMELLGIAEFEYVVSTVRGARMGQSQVNDGVGPRVSLCRPTILQQLGVFLKADDGDCEEEEEEEQPPRLAVDMEIEDGQIL